MCYLAKMAGKKVFIRAINILSKGVPEHSHLQPYIQECPFFLQVPKDARDE